MMCENMPATIAAYCITMLVVSSHLSESVTGPQRLGPRDFARIQLVETGRESWEDPKWQPGSLVVAEQLSESKRQGNVSCRKRVASKGHRGANLLESYGQVTPVRTVLRRLCEMGYHRDRARWTTYSNT